MSYVFKKQTKNPNALPIFSKDSRTWPNKYDVLPKETKNKINNNGEKQQIKKNISKTIGKPYGNYENTKNDKHLTKNI